jgi:hypothetical protein
VPGDSWRRQTDPKLHRVICLRLKDEACLGQQQQKVIPIPQGRRLICYVRQQDATNRNVPEIPQKLLMYETSVKKQSGEPGGGGSCL